MNNIIPTIDDFPGDRANCGNCTRKGGACPRTKSNKQQHNGLLYGNNKEIAGIIYRCPNGLGQVLKSIKQKKVLLKRL